MIDVKTTKAQNGKAAGLKGYAVFFLAICFFSGIFSKAQGPLRIFDFNNLLGEFGKIVPDAAPGFQGQGGFGTKAGYLHGLSIAPSVCFALAAISVFDHLGGLAAAERFLSPLLRFVLGVPGCCALTLVTSWQSSDSAAALTRELHQQGYITEDERDIFGAYQFSSGATLGLYFAHASALFPYLTKPVGLALLIQMVVKFVGANVMRFFLWQQARRRKTEQDAPVS